ncbi:MAG: hypothetical protein EOO38_29050 [Cytophagaceae bacterium]|nr:MAG: hypothetical protein EOO38_29050 [Cytophagaceae bacterium]
MQLIRINDSYKKLKRLHNGALSTMRNPVTPHAFRTVGLHKSALSLLALAVLSAAGWSGVLHAASASDAEGTAASTRTAGLYAFDISQQPLASALNEFSRITGWQVGVSSDLANKWHATPQTLVVPRLP